MRLSTQIRQDGGLQHPTSIIKNSEIHAVSPPSELEVETISKDPLADCRISFITMGTYFSPHTDNILEWIKNSDSACTLSIIRENSHFLAHSITQKERDMLSKLDSIAVSKADFVKFLVLYYYGGLVTDYDTKPRKAFPKLWPLDGCDVFLGQEHSCYDHDCIQRGGFPAAGQLQTWTLYARKRTKFMRRFLDKIMTTFETKSVHVVHVQHVAGSGMLSGFVRDFYEYLDVDTTTTGKSLRNDDSAIAKLSIDKETICVAGIFYTSGPDCLGNQNCVLLHQFEGSWQ
jgi:hypothetical protein